MTLEHQIAECNQVSFPLLAFIDLGLLQEKYVNVIDIVRTSFSDHNTMRGFMGYVAQSLKLDWLERETQRPLHPTVLALLDSNPDHCDWYAILLEWPHVSLDGERLAYTRNAAAGVQDRQTVTSLGKYLARQFSTLPSNVLRDAASLFTPDRFEMRDTVKGIVDGVQEGPNSCMRWSGHTDTYDHPYSCYAPENGWTLAVRIANDRIDGRCLCHTKDTQKIFVRSFRRDPERPDTGYSQSDVALESWLKAQGYSHENEWHDRCQINTQGDELFPYIDGGCQKVDEHGFITEYGCFNCDNTDGTRGNNDDDDCGEHCQECDERSTEGVWAGRSEDRWVCDGCRENYVYAIGYRGNEYYIRDEDAVNVGDNYYDENYLSDNHIVELADGGHAKQDNTVYIDNEYYLEDDDDVVFFNDEYHLISDRSTVELQEARPGNGDKYAHIDNTWTCADTGYIYHDDTPSVEIDGEVYHPDSATAQAFAEAEAQQLTLELEPS